MILTFVVFLGPALILGLPESLSEGAQTAFDGLAAGILAAQVAILVLITPTLMEVLRLRTKGTTFLVLVSVQAIALALAAFLALGLGVSGLGLELALVLWFAAPFALWAFLAWPRSRPTLGIWGARPMRWILLGFPLIFLSAALARVDFFFATGFRVPTAVVWLLTYLPTLIGVTLALAGWVAIERRQSGPGPRTLEISAVVGAGLAVAVITSLRPASAFILSATITFGSGYQLFTTPPPLPPLALSLFLVSLAAASLVATVVILRAERRNVVLPLLALTAVLSGIFPIARSVLGVLVALQLLTLNAERGSLR